MKDCRECRHSIKGVYSLLCRAENMPKPVEWMRREECSCGEKAEMFEAKPVRQEFGE